MKPGPTAIVSSADQALCRQFYVDPMKAAAVNAVPAGDWQLELKFDGYRAIATLVDGRVELWSRNQLPLGAKFPELICDLRRLRVKRAVLDGEIVAIDATGNTSFQLLQRAAKGGTRPLILYYVFDLLRLNGHSYLNETLERRQRDLRRLLRSTPKLVRPSAAFETSPRQLLRAVSQRGWEGIVAKRRGSFYQPGRRSSDWLKCKVRHEQEFVIGGFTQPQGSRSHFGALLVGYHRDDRLAYAGKVGTGFDQSSLAELHRRLIRLQRTRCPFDAVPEERNVTWVRPTLVAQISFADWTRDHRLRQAAFLGLRDDKHPSDVHRENGVAILQRG